jgi:hypothetical protein
MTISRTPVPAPLRNVNRAGSLLASALTPDGPRWHGGIEYRPELDNLTQSWNPTGTENKTIADPPANVQYDPYVIWQGSSEWAAASRYEDEARRTRDALDVQTSYMIEQILWTNLVDGVDYGLTHPNVALADTSAASLVTPNGITAVGIVTGIHDMLEALNLYLGGARGMIHTSQKLVPFLEFYGLIVRQGNILQVAGTDHILVAGTGYTGSDPSLNSAAGEVWLYGTSPVEVRTSEIYMNPGSEREALNRVTNTLEIRAERMAMASFDYTVCHVGIPVCIPDPGPDCSGVAT